MNDRLVEIHVSEWSDLRDLYRRDWPRHILGYNTINTVLSWVKQQKINHLSVLSLNDDWQDGTFLCLHRYVCFANTASDSLDRLKKILSILSWNVAFEDSPIMQRLYPAVTDNIFDKKLIQSFEIKSILYFMPHQEALTLEINCPPEFELKRLTEDYAESINEVWPHKHYGSLIMVRQFIKLNPNAYCLRTTVHSEYVRQGWATLVCKALAKELALKGMDSFACIVKENNSSIKMFEKIGFKAIDEVVWFGTDTGDDYDWDEY